MVAKLIRFGRQSCRVLAVGHTAGGLVALMVRELRDAIDRTTLESIVLGALDEVASCDPPNTTLRLHGCLAEKASVANLWATYAAVVIGESRIFGTTVGDIVVGLEQPHGQVDRTVAHILQNEDPKWVAETYGESPMLEVHSSMLTRALGTNRVAPSNVVWQRPPEFSLTFTDPEMSEPLRLDHAGRVLEGQRGTGIGGQYLVVPPKN